ncbi:MAG: trehalose-phosphatase [Gammaproteobacteria bacterium]|nr:trehalose-phosphatase [Gammaproteobacteria bacterium]
MKTLQPGCHPDDFFLKLSTAAQPVLLLDYDGTLAPFHVNPQEAIPWPGVCEILDSLMAQHDTRVVIVSGRWTRDLVPLLRLRQTPEIWGSHGWERRYPDGRVEITPPDERALAGLVEADSWIEKIHALGGRSESKPAGLAMHWRGLNARAIDNIMKTVTEHWEMQARDTGLALHAFDGGIELRVPGRNKGDAVRTLRRELPQAFFAYLGDDVTDEDAFNALAARDLGVLMRAELRDTAAGLWLTPPYELLDFLRRWLATREAYLAHR